MYNFTHQIDYLDHVLEFDGLCLVRAFYEPDYDDLQPVEFGHDYYIAGDSEDRKEIIARYRGLRGTPSYQVDLVIDGDCIKTLMVMTTPDGEIYTEKDCYSQF